MFQSDDGLVLIIDGLNLFTRHYVAHPALSASGESVGGVIGFLYAIANLSEKFKPTSIVVIWEGGGSSRKRAIFKDYKQKRRPEKLNRYYEGDIPDTVENRNYQISLLIEIIKNIPVCQIYVPDCEADDIIGYISKYRFKNNRKLIVSSDRDFYQLLDPNTIIYSPTWKKLVTSNQVIEKFGISPENFCLAKSVCGDPADNIAGVERVGFKTLSKKFPKMASKKSVSIDDLMQECNNMINEGNNLKSIKNISNSEGLIRRNWKLIYLDTHQLSASQIDKTNFTFDNFTINRDKIKTMRTLIKEGIQTFNVDRLFLSLNQIR
tara:strand:+ start:4402 stop:5364 length:963 start_codon:yes stop_codon:yes gene_type:complete